jgi:hypothetical protein
MLEYWKEFSAVVGALVIFFTGRKTSKISDKTANANAVDAMQSTYDVFLKHYKEQYDSLLIRLNGLELRNAILMESAQTWEKKFKDLDVKYKQLLSICEKLKNK